MQAIDSDTVTLMEFPSRVVAAAVAERYGDDAHLTAWMVIRYKDDGLTATQRTELEYWIDCTNTWVGAGGQDC